MTVNICNNCHEEFRRWGSKRPGSVYRFCSRKCYWDSMRVKKLYESEEKWL